MYVYVYLNVDQVMYDQICLYLFPKKTGKMHVCICMCVYLRVCMCACVCISVSKKKEILESFKSYPQNVS